MSRYHTKKEIEALATLADSFGYSIAGSLIRQDVRSVGVIEPDQIREHPEAAGEILEQMVEKGDRLVWIGPTTGSPAR